MYIGWYGLGRFVIEMLRTDSLYLANIKISELVAGTCVLVSIILIIIFRSMVKRNENYKLYADTDISKAQLAEYDMFVNMKSEKSQLKKQIKKAKARGEDFSKLQAEYDEKFGENAKKPEIKIDLSGDKESYRPIIEDDQAITSNLDMDTVIDESDIDELNKLEPIEASDNDKEDNDNE